VIQTANALRCAKIIAGIVHQGLRRQVLPVEDLEFKVAAAFAKDAEHQVIHANGVRL
jgi:hypothetical protein